jgi:predicted LPLAT superfamily acyltransferase
VSSVNPYGTSPAIEALDAQAWARAPERGTASALRLITWIAMTFGRRATRWLLHPITLYFVLFAPTARRQSKRYLQRALGRPARFRDGYRHVHAFTATILDRLYLLRGRLDLFDVEVRGGELIDETMAAGRGAFLVGGHVGSFEVMRAIGHAHDHALRVAMVMYPDNAQQINEALRAVAPDNEPHIIPLGRVQSMLAVRDWLDGGGLAGMLADRRLEAASDRTNDVVVPFLGQEAVFADGPVRLAALLRRRVLMMAGIYLGGNRYEVRFEPLADFSEPASPAEREAKVEQAVRDYAARLEALCRAHPYNWFNFHDFWGEDGR